MCALRPVSRNPGIPKAKYARYKARHSRNQTQLQRLMEGISGGVGFVGIIVALLARLNPLALIPTALLYGGMSVGADAMQRRVSIPSSISFVLQSLAVLLVLACDALRYYKLNLSAFRRHAAETVAGQVSK